jgi:hypothetical protein
VHLAKRDEPARAPIHTCCAAASHPQDFYNLVDVYLDAVLHPKCISDKRTFEQVRACLCLSRRRLPNPQT